jgi:hypothetical protein
MVGLPRDVEDVEVIEGEPMETQPGELIEAREPVETEHAEAEPIPIDTTAELLGRRTRKPRARRPAAAAAPTLRDPQGRAEHGRGAKKSASKKATARRSPRSKKIVAADTGGDTEA